MSNSYNSFMSKKVDFYIGTVGRKLAFERFLTILTQSDEKARLFLTSQSDLSWLSQNIDYLNDAKDMFSKILSKIEKVEVLHSFDRSASNLIFIINYWIPLYLSGKIDGYNLNDYSLDKPKTTIFILENKVCLYSIETENLEDCITFFYTEPPIIESYKKVFSLMKKSSTALNRETNYNSNECCLDILNTLKKPGNLYSLNHIMPAMFMPLHLYEKVLETLDITKSEQKKRMHIYTEYFQSTIHNTEKFHHSIIIFNNLLQEASDNPGIRYKGFYFMEDHDVFVDKKVYLEHLQYLCNLSENSKLDVFFIKSYEYVNKLPAYDYILKEDLLVYIYERSLRKEKSSFLISESEIILNTLFLLHKNILQSIPEKLKDFKATIDSTIDKEELRISTNSNELLQFFLTSRETEVANMLSSGTTIKNISNKLCISQNTVKSHLRNIYKKLGITSKYELMNFNNRQSNASSAYASKYADRKTVSLPNSDFHIPEIDNTPC